MHTFKIKQSAIKQLFRVVWVKTKQLNLEVSTQWVQTYPRNSFSCSVCVTSFGSWGRLVNLTWLNFFSVDKKNKNMHTDRSRSFHEHRICEAHAPSTHTHIHPPPLCPSKHDISSSWVTGPPECPDSRDTLGKSLISWESRYTGAMEPSLPPILPHPSPLPESHITDSEAEMIKKKPKCCSI